MPGTGFPLPQVKPIAPPPTGTDMDNKYLHSFTLAGREMFLDNLKIKSYITYKVEFDEKRKCPVITLVLPLRGWSGTSSKKGADIGANNSNGNL